MICGSYLNVFFSGKEHMNITNPYITLITLLLLINILLLYLYIRARRTEKTILKREVRFRKLAETAPEGIVIHKDGILHEANDQFYSMFRYKAEELTGTSFIPVIMPSKALKIIKNRTLSGNNAPYEVLAKRGDGTRFPIKVFSRKPVNKNQLFRITVFQDISGKNETTEVLMQSDQKYKKLIDTMNEGMMVLDEHNIIQFANPSMLKILDITEDELLGSRVEDFLTGENLGIVKKQISLRKKGISGPYQLTWTRKTGKDVQTRMSPHGYFDLEGNFKGSFAIITDLTATIEMEKQLIQAQKMEAIGTLAGGIAHDFNNILSAILGYTQIALNRLPENSDAVSSIKEVYHAGIRASELVKQILAFARQKNHDLKPLKIHTIVREVLKLIRASIPTTIEIQEEINHDCHAVIADPTRIHQIVMNLCTNAYHAMREGGGTLHVGLTNTDYIPCDPDTTGEFQKGPYIMLTIQDTGCGMDSYTIKQIFDPYFTTKEKEEGTGLGLAIVDSIVHSYGGDIQVTSNHGSGTTFTVYLPAVKDEFHSGETLSSNLKPSGHEHILVVDDEETLVLMIKETLESKGYRITPQTSSKKVLELFKTGNMDIDLMITDMNMPGLDGINLTKEILKHQPDLPVILCTGYSEQITKEKITAVGIRKLLMKPVLENDLITAIRDTMKQNEKN